MKRYIAQFVPWSGGLYAVLDTQENRFVGQPGPYHAATTRGASMQGALFFCVANLPASG